MNRAETMAEVWAASGKARENNDCTVKALAIVTELDYSTVHAAFAKAGRKPRKGANRAISAKAAKLLGFHMEQVDSHISARTAITIEREPSLQSGRYVIGMTRHLAAMIDGKLVDWSEGRRKKINAVYALSPIAGWSPASNITVPVHEWLPIPSQQGFQF